MQTVRKGNRHVEGMEKSYENHSWFLRLNDHTVGYRHNKELFHWIEFKQYWQGNEMMKVDKIVEDDQVSLIRHHISIHCHFHAEDQN
jgi:hypothetical protein